MKKFKNYSFTMGLVSAVMLVVVQILAAFDVYISSETVSNIISVILGALVVIGVINKPSENEQTEIENKIDEAAKKDETDLNNNEN